MTARIVVGDVREVLGCLSDGLVHTVVTSPPYFGLRDYKVTGQMGLEKTPDEYVAALVKVFREVRRVLRDDGTLWLNLGDSYAGSWGNQGRKEERGSQRPINGPMIQNLQPYPDKQANTGKCPPGFKSKDLIGTPWRVAFALQADGWYLRQDIIWHKPNPMPESVRDRCTKAHEYIFMLSKQERYYFDSDAMQEPATGRDPGNKSHKYTKQYEQDDNEMHRTKAGLKAVGPRETRKRRSVWTVSTKPFKGAHFATFPPDLIEPCILAGCPPGGTVLDPFFGAGTTGLVANAHGRHSLGIELNPDYAEIARVRIGGDTKVWHAQKKEQAA